MTKDDIKLKYIIGLHRDLPEYPTQEDLLYTVNRWYHLDGGREHIHGFMKIEDVDKVIFSNKHLVSLLDNEKIANEIISRMVKDKSITEHKKTAHTTYYQVETKNQT